MRRIHLVCLSLALFILLIATLAMHKQVNLSLTRFKTESLASQVARNVSVDWDMNALRPYAHPILQRNMDASPDNVSAMANIVRTLGRAVEEPTCNLLSVTTFQGDEGAFDAATYRCRVRTASASADLTLALRHDNMSKDWQVVEFNINSPYLENQLKGGQKEKPAKPESDAL